MTQPPYSAQPSPAGLPLAVRTGDETDPPPARTALPSAESWFDGVPPVVRRGLDHFAVTAFVLSLPGLMPIAVVFAAIGLRRIRRSGARGRWLALAALAISACWVIAIAVAAALGVYGDIRAGIGRSMSISQVRVNQCFDAHLDAGTLRMVRIADCSKPHSGEAYAKVKASLTGLSAEATEAEATQQCAAAFQQFVGKPYEESALDMYYVVLEDRAVASGNVLCMVGKPGEELTGTMRGSQR
jgi:hypothetical protein